jgi:DNA-binding CsgD family transcriptional regulator
VQAGPVSDDVLASLSPRQREVYRLIGAGILIKNIGERLGIREATVRDHIKAVRAKLPNRSNETIARMLAAYESAHPQSWGTTPQSVESAAVVPLAPSRPDDIDRSGQERMEPGLIAKGGILGLLFPRLGRPPNALDTSARIALILLMTVLAMAAILAGGWALIAFSDYLRDLNRHGG